MKTKNYWTFAFLFFCLLTGAEESFGDFLERKTNRTRDFRQNRSLDCGKYVLNPGEEVTINSKEYFKSHPEGGRCVWRFKGTTENTTFRMSCNDVKLQKCYVSKLTVKNHIEFNHKYCKTDSSFQDGSPKNRMQVVFTASQDAQDTTSFDCTVRALGNVDPGATEQPSSSCKCGVANSEQKIVGGEVTLLHEYPWQAALIFSWGPIPFCGASIISDLWILTAAHCVISFNKDEIRVAIGEHKWTTDTETDVREEKVISKIVVHPDYDKFTLDSDLALIKLASKISFQSNNKIAPVCLPRPNLLYENVDAIVSGWGTLAEGGIQPEELNEVTVPTMSNSECSRFLPGDITDNMLCAGYPEGGKDSCQGDSGGPLFTERTTGVVKPYMEQIGIVSWGYGCANRRKPGVYTRVNNYLDWIDGIIKGSTKCPPPTS